MADENQSLDAAAAAIAALRQPEPDQGTPARAKKEAAAAVVETVDDDPLGVEGASGTTAATEQADDDAPALDGNEDEAQDGAEGGEDDGEEGNEAVGEADDAPRSILEAADPEELDREVFIPSGPGGELEKTTFRELIRGGLREADYTRKTQQLAVLAQHHVQKRDEIETVLPILIDQIKAGIGERSEEEWSALFERDPAKYAIERDRERINKEKLALAQSNLQRIQMERQAEMQYQQQVHAVREANALKAKLRDLKDKQSIGKFVSDVTEYLKSSPDIRASDDEIGLLADHRYFILAAKAMKLDKMMQAKQSAQPKQVLPGAKSAPAPLKPGVVKPGASTAATSVQRKVEKTREVLKKTGSIDSAAAALAARREAAARSSKRR
jgi:hypothetical protein